ncbi:MAG: DivIVA domain-containing protein, partial [Clostridiales bacterium]|nr:DivIVA domain-containing protein [Clostridiales bacterium]
MITPTQIKEKVLSTASHGYDIDETNAFIDEIQQAFSAVYDENKELYRKMDILAAKIEEYRTEEESIKDTLLTAQKVASQVRREAKEKADNLLAESAQTVQKTVLEAKEKAEKIISEARDYSAELTKKKTDAANEIAREAKENAEKEINAAKADASALLTEAKNIAENLLKTAKEEKEYYDNLTASLKTDSESFKKQLVSLYNSQLETLNQMVVPSSEIEDKGFEEKITEAEKNIIAASEKIEEIENSDSQSSEMQNDASPETESTEQETDEITESEKEAEDESNENDQEISSDEEVKEDSADDSDDFEYELEEISGDESRKIDAGDMDVNEAVEDFSKDAQSGKSELNPETEKNDGSDEKGIPEEEHLPFESFFNVK